MNTKQIIDLVLEEQKTRLDSKGSFHSVHEGYAIIKEELEKLWNRVRENNTKCACDEAIQVAAMAVQFMIDFMELTEEEGIYVPIEVLHEYDRRKRAKSVQST